MKLQTFKAKLKAIDNLQFITPEGKFIASHFHITAVGQINKNFIDCGGKLRQELVISFQLWHANDFNHRLSPQKLLSIIELSEEKLNLKDAEIEVELQGKTIETYGLEDFEGNFLLTPMTTACLAEDSCGIPAQIENDNSSLCTPGGGCC